MKHLAIFTPLPPSTSGIGQYSAELLPELAKHYRLTVVIADDAPLPDPVQAEITIRRASAFAMAHSTADARLYHVGNSPEHAYILDWAEREPGICVLHDVTVQHLQVWRALHGGTTAAARYRTEMRRRYGPDGEAAADVLLNNRRPALPYAAIPLCEQIVEGSMATIVHSDFAAGAVRHHCPGAMVVVVPHGVPLLPQGDRTIARALLGLPEGAVIIAALGNLIPEKRLEVALSAFTRALYNLPEALFVVAGAGSRHYDPRVFARTHGLEPVTRWLGRVEAAQFEALLVAADLCVNLRWPTGGETSGSLLRMLAAGRATLVTDTGSFAEVPPAASIKVPLGPDEETTIVRAIVRAGREPGWADRIGARAREFVAERHSFARTIAGYRMVIEQVLS
ncbi:MAG TPA: glycosyltransferase family 4 protein [Thermomicrobiales bacterium]